MAEHDLGVLLVHGIGRQQRGDTLVDAGDPLVGWFQRWLGKERSPVRRARITPFPEDPTAPAHLELLVGSPAGDADGDGAQTPDPSRWLVAESWWAKSFREARFAQLAAWGFKVLPWLAISHAAAKLRKAWTSEPLFFSTSRALRWGERALFLLVSVIVLLLVVALVPVLAVSLVVLRILAVLPFPRFQAAVETIVTTLASTVGDSFTLLESPVQSAAIVDQVRRDLRWLSQRCDRVAVVAHSQGAAIAHRALRGEEIPRIARLVTFGSGLAKLHGIDRLHERGGFAAPWCAPVGLLLLGVAALRTALGSLGAVALDDATGPLATGVLGLGFFLAGVAACWPHRPDAPDELRVDGADRWIDISASADPVSGGAPINIDEASVSGIVPHKVHNLASSLRDHTSYWANQDQFVAAVAAELGDAVDVDVDAVDFRAQDQRVAAGRRRRWRVAALVGLRLLTVATTLGLVVARWGELSAFGEDALTVTAAVLSALPFVSIELPRGLADAPLSAVGVGAAGVLALGASGLVRLLWRRWDHAEIARFFERQDYRGIEPSLGAVVFGWLFLAELAGLLAVGAGGSIAPALVAAATVLLVCLFVPQLAETANGDPVRDLAARMGLGHGGALSSAHYAAWGATVAAVTLPAVALAQATRGAASALPWGLVGAAAVFAPLSTRTAAWRRLGCRWREFSHAGSVHLAAATAGDAVDVAALQRAVDDAERRVRRYRLELGARRLAVGLAPATWEGLPDEACRQAAAEYRDTDPRLLGEAARELDRALSDAVRTARWCLNTQRLADAARLLDLAAAVSRFARQERDRLLRPDRLATVRAA